MKKKLIYLTVFLLLLSGALSIGARRSRPASASALKAKRQNQLLDFWSDRSNERRIAALYLPADSVMTAWKMRKLFPIPLIIGGNRISWRIEYQGIPGKAVYMYDPIDMYPVIPEGGTLVISPLDYDDAYISKIMISSEVIKGWTPDAVEWKGYKVLGPDTFKLTIPSNPTDAPRIYHVKTRYRELEEEAARDTVFPPPTGSTLKIYQLPRGGTAKDLPQQDKFYYEEFGDRFANR